MGRIAVLILLVLLAGCSTKESEKPTYQPYHVLSNPPSDSSVAGMVRAFRGIPEPVFTTDQNYDSGWVYAVGNPSEGLFTRVNKFTGVHIILPHREEKPDHPLWYRRTITFSEKGILRIDADDGAQLYLNDKHLARVDGVYFPVDTTGTFR